MQISGLGPIHNAQPVQAPQRAQAAQSAAPLDTWSGVDQVDISPEADFVSRVRDAPDIRQERIAEIRAQIAEGTYETAGKLEMAVGRLLDEFAG